MPFTNYSYASGLAALSQGIDAANKAVALQDKKMTLGDLGRKVQAGDYTGAAQDAFSGGDVTTGLALLKMKQTADSGAQFNDLLGQATGGDATLGNLAGTAPQARAAAADDNSDAAGPARFASNSAFVDTLAPHAIAASDATGVDPRIILAQSAIETGYGKHAPGSNYFGIKGPGQSLATTEVVDGQPVRTQDSFRTFGGVGESAAAYADFINRNPRYAGLKAAQGLDAQAAALQASGYATDPQYGAKVLSIARGLPDLRAARGNAQADRAAPGARPAGLTATGTDGFTMIDGFAVPNGDSDARQAADPDVAALFAPPGQVVRGGASTNLPGADPIRPAGGFGWPDIPASGAPVESLDVGSARPGEANREPMQVTVNPSRAGSGGTSRPPLGANVDRAVPFASGTSRLSNVEVPLPPRRPDDMEPVEPEAVGAPMPAQPDLSNSRDAGALAFATGGVSPADLPAPGAREAQFTAGTAPKLGSVPIPIPEARALIAAPDTAETRSAFDARYGAGASTAVLKRPLQADSGQGGGGASTVSATAAPASGPRLGSVPIPIPEARALIATPDTAEARAAFDTKYGAGAAQAVLKRPAPPPSTMGTPVPSAAPTAAANSDPLVVVPGINGGRPINRAWVQAAPDGADIPEDGQLEAAQASVARAGGAQPGPGLPAEVAAPATPGADPRATSAGAAKGMTQAGFPAPVTSTIARTAPGSALRIRTLARAASLPGISDGQRAVAMALFNNELSQSKMPDRFREYEIAIAKGWTTAKNPTDYKQEQERDDGAKIREQTAARQEMAEARGLDTKSPEVQRYILDGKFPGAGRAQTPDQLDQSRLKVLQNNGIDPASTEGQHYRMTGQHLDPGKVSEMKATEQKMYAANVEKTSILDQQIKDLTKARELNPQVYSGNYAPGVAQAINRNAPGWLGGLVVDPNRATATTQYENLVNGATLSQGKELFGARPTNYDEKLLQALKANPNMTPQERDTILGQMIEHRRALLHETQENTAAMKGGSFFRRGGQPAGVQPNGRGAEAASGARGPGPAARVPASAADALRSNPDRAAEFDAKFGAGAAAQILGGR